MIWDHKKRPFMAKMGFVKSDHRKSTFGRFVDIWWVRYSHSDDKKTFIRSRFKSNNFKIFVFKCFSYPFHVSYPCMYQFCIKLKSNSNAFIYFVLDYSNNILV